MSTLVKAFLVPGSVSFLVVALVVGVALLYGSDRMRRWGRIWLTLVLLAYAFLATPLGADAVAAPLLRGFTPITSKEQAQGVDVLVVLSTGGEVYRGYGEEVAEMGKATAFNALEAARLYKLVAPRTVIASGGIVDPEARRVTEAEILANGLARLGIPRERIVLEQKSRTTREQAVNVAEMLKKRGIRKFLLVTGADHMPRARATFRELGFDPVASVAKYAIAWHPSLLERLSPGINALRQSDWACYEYLARIYYWWEGWL
jgi:uncharacterized SAM-binding protein YcdF (DUF218 family)